LFLARSPITAVAMGSDEASTEKVFSVVGVGASAGGLEAFSQLLAALPADSGMAFVLVQHLAPTHPSALAEILSRTTTMPVLEVVDEPTVQPNHVYVIPPARNMVISGGRLQLFPRPSAGVHHPVDEFFRSLAEDRKHGAIGVVLSGTASDGTLGLEAIKAEGGITFAQDGSARHEGMPHSAIASGMVDFVLLPDSIARELVRIARHPYSAPDDGDLAAAGLTPILQILQRSVGVDFTNYKFNTLHRRITRRMVLQRVEGLAEYTTLLRETPSEVEALYQDILINVTSFFRDAEAFEELKRHVFPRLAQHRARHEPVRFWSLGCSTGQEAYSLAIAFAEFAEETGTSLPLQLFATDLSAAGIEHARAGIYPKDIAQNLSSQRLRRFFTEVDGQYRISKSIRDACVFSRHNILTDPPFSRIDLISCRNLLIYMEPVLQNRILPALHYALKPSGYLWLGASETVGTHRNLFEVEDGKHRIFARKPAAGRAASGVFPVRPYTRSTPASAPLVGEVRDLSKEVERVLATKFVPPGVLVSASLDILQFRGQTGAYLAPAAGDASLGLLKMLREGLAVPVRATLQRAAKSAAPVREEGVRVRSGENHLEIAVEVIPVGGQGKTGGFLVLFDDGTVSRATDQRRSAAPSVDEAAADAAPSPELVNADRLERELTDTRDYLQSVIEQQEAANEEILASVPAAV
jgi:two-component system CheB/CheR fusion protein